MGFVYLHYFETYFNTHTNKNIPSSFISFYVLYQEYINACVFTKQKQLPYSYSEAWEEFAKRPSPIQRNTMIIQTYRYREGHKTKYYQIIQLIHLAPAVKEIVFLFFHTMHFTIIKLCLLFECLLLASCFQKGASLHYIHIWSWYTTNELK